MNQQPLQTPPENIPPAQPAQPAPSSQPSQSVPPTDSGIGFQPTSMQPAPGGSSKSWISIVVLLVILIIGGLVFASWQGWISLGGIEKYWKKTETVTPIPKPVPTAKENDQTRKSDLKNIKDALKKYYQANQNYPTASSTQKTSDANNALTVLVSADIASLPLDPLSPTYYYGYISDGKTFEITARMEDITDPLAIKVNDNLYIYKVTDTSTETPGVTNSQ